MELLKTHFGLYYGVGLGWKMDKYGDDNIALYMHTITFLCFQYCWVLREKRK